MTKIKLLTLLAAMLATTFLFAQDSNPQLKINFSTKGKKGILYVAVYDNDADYMKNKVQKLKLDMSDGENAQLVVEDLTEGKDYAFTCFLDMNNNQKLDKNVFGMPVEPYGFSRNTKGMFGPPSFNDTKLNFKQEDNPVSIIVD